MVISNSQWRCLAFYKPEQEMIIISSNAFYVNLKTYGGWQLIAAVLALSPGSTIIAVATPETRRIGRSS